MTDPILGFGTATPGTTAANAPQAKAVLSSDFETFIKMLTTQAEYQDPLEPLDSSEYAAQLAQFSMVEQQVLSNDLLTALTSALNGGGIGQMASWIGMEGRTTQPVQFDGAPITVMPQPAANAQSATLVVIDAGGRTIDRQSMPATAQNVLWAGVRGDGTPFAPGRYRFEVESFDAAGEPLPTTEAGSYARITEIRAEGAESRVIFAGGSEAPADSITALREAG